VNAEGSNLFTHTAVRPSEEFTHSLLQTTSFRLEQIVSNGSCTPAGDWYDQASDEWVIVLKGKARLRFEHPDAEIELAPGDHVNIGAHRRHRVEWTTPDETTVWLALHYSR